MLIAAIAAGVFAWLLTGSIIGVIVTHGNNNGSAGMFPGLVAGIWAAWPLLHQGRVQRINFLHPVPKRYKVPVKQAFKRVREILDEKIYNFGDGWKVSTADTQAKKIKATLKWTDEETKMEPGHGGQVNTRTVRVQRLLELDIQMKEEPNDSTIIQFDFHPRIEGMTYIACDSKVEGLLADVEAALGAGTAAGNPMATNLPAPPWWLLGLTAFALFLLLGDVVQAVFH
jgi:hypothetical protein